MVSIETRDDVSPASADSDAAAAKKDEFNESLDKTVNTSVLELEGQIQAGFPTDDVPLEKRIRHRHKYRPAMKMAFPVRFTKGPEGEMPMNYAGLFSVITFSWMSELMWKIYRKGIDNVQLWRCSKPESCKVNVDRFENGWNADVAERGLENASLIRVIRKLFLKRIIAALCIILITLVFTFMGPAWLINWLLEYLSIRGEKSLGYGIALVAGLVMSEFGRSLSMSCWWFLNYQTGVRTRSGCLGLLFKKIMRLRTLKDTNIGELINMCTSDGQRIFEAMCLVPFLPSVCLVLLTGIIYTVFLIGPWGFLGTFTFLFFFPLLISISRLTTRFRQQAVRVTDHRIRLMSELLNCIKLIKMYAWEDSFSQQIADIRRTERKLLEKAAYTQSIAVSSSPFIPLVSAAVTFIAHTLTGNDLTPAQAFTMLAVLNAMRFSVGVLPYCIRAFAEGLVTIRRFHKILKLEDIAPTKSEVKDKDQAIVFDHMTMAWDIPKQEASVVDTKKKSKASTVTEKSNGATENKLATPTKQDKKSGSTDEEKHELLTAKENGLPLTTTTPAAAAVAGGGGGGEEGDADIAVVLHDINLVVKKGHLIGICGSVGSGKSSMISAILGKMVSQSGSVAVNGSVAYVAQQAWIMNCTLRENIIFGRKFDEEKYKAVIEACGLQPDINTLVAGDNTEIGERGINLSGGQKQRVSLARSLYSDSDIYLLDDPLSAVDVHIGKHIFTYCLKDVLQEKTVMFVTHQLQYLRHCDSVIFMKEGQILENGTHDELMVADNEYANLIKIYYTEHPVEVDEMDEETGEIDAMYSTFGIVSPTDVDIVNRQGTPERQMSILNENTNINNSNQNEQEDGKLIIAEEMEEGAVSLKIYKDYIRAAGGAIVFILVMTIFILTIGCQAFASWWLAYWLEHGSGNTTIQVGNMSFISRSIVDNPDLEFYTTVYGCLLVAVFITTAIKGIIFMKVTLRASSRLHNSVCRKIMTCPMSFFDTVPSGRILNRFSKDMDEIDVFLPFRSETFLQNVLLITSGLVMISIVSPWFLIALVPLLVLFYYLNKLFITGVRALKRQDNVTRSPLLSHVGAAVQGISTIHAYGKTQEFIDKFDELLDINTVPFFLFSCSNRWLAIRLDVISIAITGITGVIVVLLNDQITPALAGLALSFAVQMTGLFQFTVRMAIETEARFTSVERIQYYIDNTESEADAVVDDNRPSADWPRNGALSFSNYEMKYRENLPTVLKGVTIDIDPDEKIGIVGRTGSGKSSLGVALFRLVEASGGSIKIDDIDISEIGLKDLRSRLSIIPQDPVLFVGTIRYNLDPFNEHSDTDLWDALEKCHVKETVGNLDQQLDAPVVENGENFSLGERQLLCMARALLRHSKIIMLDEATAAIDTEKDAQIQATIKEAFSDCTILIIAHRLNTVLNCDRILVMDDGQVVEFDRPGTLLAKEDSAFKRMLEDAQAHQDSLDIVE